MGSQLAQVNNETIVEAMKRICHYMPDKYQVLPFYESQWILERKKGFVFIVTL